MKRPRNIMERLDEQWDTLSKLDNEVGASTLSPAEKDHALHILRMLFGRIEKRYAAALARQVRRR